MKKTLSQETNGFAPSPGATPTAPSLSIVPKSTSASQAGLAIKNVSKTFTTDAGSIQALDSVSFDVRPGEFLCLLGPSGCGKSTLLNLIAGLDTCDQGSLQLNGHTIEGTDPERLVIFQEGGLFPWLTVRQNVEFGLKIRGTPKRDRRYLAEETLASVGLSKFIDAYPHQLSGGMKQRAAIARGLVLDPKVLLMDEPFAALDAQTRDRLHEELQEIWHRSSKTIVFVTHNVREAACLADRIILLSPHPGRVYKEYKVDAPRPRAIENSSVMDVVRTVQADLKTVVHVGQIKSEESK